MRELIFTTRIRAKKRVEVRKRRRGRFLTINRDRREMEGEGVRGRKLSEGRQRQSRVWEDRRDVRKASEGRFIGVGRLGERATKYENITSSPPM